METSADKSGRFEIEHDVLNLEDAARLLQIHPHTLRKKAATWGVPHKRLGASYRFSKRTLTAWLQEWDTGLQQQSGLEH